MKDIFGNSKPVQIEGGKWWFNGRIIQEQNHPKLSPYITFPDTDLASYTSTHATKKEAVQYCVENPTKRPARFPHDYVGGKRYYKIVEEDYNGQFKTLFHGINGTRVLPLNTWLKVSTKRKRADLRFIWLMKF